MPPITKVAAKLNFVLVPLAVAAALFVGGKHLATTELRKSEYAFEVSVKSLMVANRAETLASKALLGALQGAAVDSDAVQFLSATPAGLGFKATLKSSARSASCVLKASESSAGIAPIDDLRKKVIGAHEKVIQASADLTAAAARVTAAEESFILRATTFGKMKAGGMSAIRAAFVAAGDEARDSKC